MYQMTKVYLVLHLIIKQSSLSKIMKMCSFLILRCCQVMQIQQMIWRAQTYLPSASLASRFLAFFTTMFKTITGG